MADLRWKHCENEHAARHGCVEGTKPKIVGCWSKLRSDVGHAAARIAACGARRRMGI